MFLLTVSYFLITWSKSGKKSKKILQLIVKYLWWYFPLQWSILAVRSSWPLAIMNHMIIQRLIIYSVFIRLKPKWERLVVKIWSLRILIKLLSHPRNILYFFFLKKVWIVNCLHSEEKVLFGSFGSQWYVSLLSAEPTLDARLAEKSILES